MNQKPSQRRLAAILIADVVGFSKLISHDDIGTLALLKQRQGLIEQAISRHGGRIFGGAGDSVVAEFPSAVEAVAAATEMQSAIATANANLAAEDKMTFRVGVNLGDVVVEEGNLFGDGVNVAERLQALAPPGGVCVSASVHEQVRDKLALAFNDLGEKQLKNIAHPVRVFAIGSPVKERARRLPRIPTTKRNVAAALALAGIVLLAAILWFVRFNPPILNQPSSGPPVVAVLPFANLSGDPAQDYFSEGVAGDISSALGRFPEISVIAHNAVAQFRGEHADPDAVRQKLGANFLVDGSIRQSGKRVRVSVSLMDTETKRQLWSQQYDRDLDDIFAVQDDIVQSVASRLVAELSRVEHERSFQKPPDSLDAYGLLLRGRFVKDKRTREANAEARAFFEKAVARDSRFAAALTALGYTHLSDATEGWTEFYGDALDKAQQLAERALAIEPQLAEGHQLLGDAYSARKDYDHGLAEIRKAIELNPSSASAYATEAWTLLYIGDSKGVIRAMETALKLDPMLNFEDRHVLGFGYYLEGRYEEAVSVLEPLAAKKGFYFPYACLAAAYAELGREADAKRAAGEVKRLWPFFTIADFVAQWRDQKAADRLADGLKKSGLQ